MEKQASLPSPNTTPQLPERPPLARRASHIMRLANLLVSAFLCLATVAALVIPLQSRDDIPSTFTYKVHILCPTVVSSTDRLATGSARNLYPRRPWDGSLPGWARKPLMSFIISFYILLFRSLPALVSSTHPTSVGLGSRSKSLATTSSLGLKSSTNSYSLVAMVRVGIM